MIDWLNGCFSAHQHSKVITANQRFYIAFWSVFVASRDRRPKVYHGTHAGEIFEGIEHKLFERFIENYFKITRSVGHNVKMLPQEPSTITSA
jgi:hypothetical protein